MRVIVLLAFVLSGCTDAAKSSLSAYGESADISCYSGGKEIFTARSTGKVSSLQGGGYSFRTVDGRYVETFADCFVSYK